MAGLVVTDKEQRVAHFHRQTVKSVAELLTASGLDEISQLDRSSIFRRVSTSQIARYDELYPYPETGCMAQGTPPENLRSIFAAASVDSFKPLPTH